MRRSGPGAGIPACCADPIPTVVRRGYDPRAVGSDWPWLWNCSMSSVRISSLFSSPGLSDARNPGPMVIADRGCLPERGSGYASSRLALLTGSVQVHALDSGTGCLRQFPYPGWRACDSRLGPGFMHAAQGLGRTAGADRFSSNIHGYFDLGKVSADSSSGAVRQSTVSTIPTSEAPIQVRTLARRAPLLRSGVMLHWSARRAAPERHR